MRQRNSGPSRHFATADDVTRTPYIASPCAWRQCWRERYEDSPVCEVHAVAIAIRIKDHPALHKAMQPVGTRPQRKRTRPPSNECQPYVYYVMLSPVVVKIGYTRNLRHRMTSLRLNRQYVVALEFGDVNVEKQRHAQFAAERFGKPEDFRLSDALKAHIESLQPRLDEMLTLAMDYPTLLQEESA